MSDPRERRFKAGQVWESNDEKRAWLVERVYRDGRAVLRSVVDGWAVTVPEPSAQWNNHSEWRLREAR